MNNKLDTAVGVVREHLKANCYSYSVTMGYLRCYRLFGLYLTDKEKPYSNAMAEQWLQSIASGLCKSSFK